MSACGPNHPIHVAIVARGRSPTFVRQGTELAGQLRSSVPAGQVGVEERVIAGTATALVLAALTKPTDVLVVLGHTSVDDEATTMLGIDAAALRGVLHAHAVVLATGFLGEEPYLSTARTFTATPTTAVVCAGRAPHAHSTILLPKLLTTLLRCKQAADWTSALHHAMEKTMMQLATQRPHMDAAAGASANWDKFRTGTRQIRPMAGTLRGPLALRGRSSVRNGGFRVLCPSSSQAQSGPAEVSATRVSSRGRGVRPRCRGGRLPRGRRGTSRPRSARPLRRGRRGCGSTGTK